MDDPFDLIELLLIFYQKNPPSYNMNPEFQWITKQLSYKEQSTPLQGAHAVLQLSD